LSFNMTTLSYCLLCLITVELGNQLAYKMTMSILTFDQVVIQYDQIVDENLCCYLRESFNCLIAIKFCAKCSEICLVFILNLSTVCTIFSNGVLLILDCVLLFRVTCVCTNLFYLSVCFIFSKLCLQ